MVRMAFEGAIQVSLRYQDVRANVCDVCLRECTEEMADVEDMYNYGVTGGTADDRLKRLNVIARHSQVSFLTASRAARWTANHIERRRRRSETEIGHLVIRAFCFHFTHGCERIVSSINPCALSQ
jgi:hypothetical protein